MDNVEDTTFTWENCPPEILLIIFELLDVKSLINCMVVSIRWRNIAKKIVKHVGCGWKKYVELSLSDKGASFRKKSKLNYKDMIVNSCLWQDVSLTTTQDSFMYNISEVLKINVYKDRIIVVTCWEVKYFDIEDHRLTKTLPISCINFDENDYMFMKIDTCKDILTRSGKYKTLTLYGKENAKSDLDDYNKYEHKVVLYRLHENRCYFATSEYCIFVAKWEQYVWTPALVARYFGFGTIIDINVYRDDLLALLNWGGMLQVDHGGVKFKLNNKKRSSLVLEIPNYNNGSTLFEKGGAIVAVPSDKPFNIKITDPDYWVLQCPDLSCTLIHGNMILLGYKSGKIEVFNPSRFHQNGCKVPPTPLATYTVQKLARHDVTDPAVRHLDVAEVMGAHILFIATSTYVHQISLRYR